MRCYSPKPMEAYAINAGGTLWPAAENPVQWNLIWLSFPEYDKIIEPEFNVTQFQLGGRKGALQAWVFMWMCNTPPLNTLMGQSAVEFVQDLQDKLDISDAYKSMGGQTWLDTMTRRAYESDGLGDIYTVAMKSANVVLADFTARREVKVIWRDK